MGPNGPLVPKGIKDYSKKEENIIVHTKCTLIEKIVSQTEDSSVFEKDVSDFQFEVCKFHFNISNMQPRMFMNCKSK